MLWAAAGCHEDIVNQMIELGANMFEQSIDEADSGGHKDLAKHIAQIRYSRR